MRLGAILVPSAIVIAIGTIVAAQSGWLDGAPEPNLVLADRTIHGAPPRELATPARTASASPRSGVSAPAKETVSVGRSVRRDSEAAERPQAPLHPGGGAVLDIDGDGGAPAATDALTQAKDEAAKARKDLLEVTQASIAAQHASEAEFDRQKVELTGQIEQLRAKVEAASASTPADDAKTAAANQAADKAAAQQIATAQQALTDTKTRAKRLDDRVRALEAELATNKAAAALAATKAASADRLAADVAAARQRETDLREKLATLQEASDPPRSKASATPPVAPETMPTVEGRSVAALQDDLAGARRGEDTLRRENGVLQRELIESRAAAKSIGEKLAALQVGLGRPVPPVVEEPARRGRTKGSDQQSERAPTVRQPGAPKIGFAHGDGRAKVDAASRARAGRWSAAVDAQAMGARFVTIRPDQAPPAFNHRASRRRDRELWRERVVEFGPPPFSDEMPTFGSR